MSKFTYLVYFNVYCQDRLTGSYRCRVTLDHLFGSNETDEDLVEKMALKMVKEKDGDVVSLCLSGITPLPI